MPISVPTPIIILSKEMQAKAMRLTFDEIDEHTFMVHGDSGTYKVTYIDGVLSCECKSFDYRSRCSHGGCISLRKQEVFK